MKDDESSDQNSQTMSACVNSDFTHMRKGPYACPYEFIFFFCHYVIFKIIGTLMLQ